jgi:hypothetical protein
VGSRDAHKATARTLMRTLGKSLRRAPTPCDNYIQRESFSASSAPTRSAITLTRYIATGHTKEWQQKNARVSCPIHLPLYSQPRGSVHLWPSEVKKLAIVLLVLLLKSSSNEPFHVDREDSNLARAQL